MENQNPTKTETAQSPETVLGVEAGKSIAIIAYLTLIGLLIAFMMNNDKKNEFARYHIVQMLGLCLTGLALGVLNVVPLIGWLIAALGSVFLLFLWVSGIINAAGGKQKPVPVLGKKYEEWLKNI